MKFQDKLQILRKENGMSQEKLAEKVGISRQAVAKCEMGKSYPDFDKIVILGDLFRISIDKLIKDYYDENCSFEFTKQLDYINEKEIEFLRLAKKATYAGKGAETISSRPNSHNQKVPQGTQTNCQQFVLLRVNEIPKGFET